MTPYAYHIKKPDFIGDYIVPLNQLGKINPVLAAKALEKYKGREHHQEKVVYDPQTTINLDLGSEKLYWGDVAFFTLHHPQLARDALKNLGFEFTQPWRFFQIPLDRFSSRCFVWLYETEHKLYLEPSECYTIKEAINRIDLEKLSEQTLEYYQEAKDAGKRPVLYGNVPHLLSPDPVDIRGVHIIDIN